MKAHIHLHHIQKQDLENLKHQDNIFKENYFYVHVIENH